MTTTYSEPPAVVTGQLMTAGNWNSWVVDNMKALWPYTTKGDLALASAANAIGRLAAGADYNIIYALASQALGAKYGPLGDLLQLARQTNGISTNTTSTWDNYVDITNATITLTLVRQSSILLLATASITSTSGADEYIKGIIDGTDQPESINTIPAGQIRQWSYTALKTGVAAGSRTVKLQFCSGNGNQVNFYNGLLMALVIPTA